MTAQEFLESFTVEATAQELTLSEDRRFYVAKATVTLKHKSGSTFTTPWTAGIATLKPEQFSKPKKAVRAGVSGLYTVAGLLRAIENNHYKVIYDHAEAMKKLIATWTPEKIRVLHALMWDAVLYAEYHDFGDFSKALGFGDCGKALEAFEHCRNAYTWFTLDLGFCADDLRRLAEELDKM